MIDRCLPTESKDQPKPFRTVIATTDRVLYERVGTAHLELPAEMLKAEDIAQLREFSLQRAPDLLMVDTELVPAATIPELTTSIPIVIVTEDLRDIPFVKLSDHQVWSCLIRPLRTADIFSALSLAIGYLQRTRQLTVEVNRLRQTLDSNHKDVCHHE